MIRTSPDIAILELVDELLEAHLDTVDRIDGAASDLVLGSHADYLRALYRQGQALLAELSEDD